MSSIFTNGQLLINRYEILGFLNAGSMQEVYHCHDHALNRQVVVKSPLGGMKDRRFRRGAEMGARVNHPNVAATFDYYEDANIIFLVEEYIQGQDLGRYFSAHFHYLDPALAAHVIHHIARGLSAAHQQGICHRDLKPSNVMTSGDMGFSAIKLTDFGIAKLAENELAHEIELFNHDSTLTTSGTLLGAIPYMAPECWRNWTQAGKEMDVWALGCIGYQLLTGALPFGLGRNAIAAVVQAEAKGKVELAEPGWFHTHPDTANLENDLWGLVLSCLEINPESRPQARELVERCGSICYAATLRQEGIIDSYRIKYQNGGSGDFGFISAKQGGKVYYHRTVFYGDGPPSPNQRVCYSSYPGTPKPRSSPVLLLKPLAS